VTARLATADVIDLTACLSIPVAQLLQERLGRPLRGQLADQDVIRRIRAPGLVKLQTTGPVTHRHVILRDSQEPHLPVAVAWALVVVRRLPPSVREGLKSGEPLDRLLTAHGSAWTAEVLPDEYRLTTTEQLSANFPWAAPDTPAAEVTRILSVGARLLAVLIDEVPRLPQLGPAEPLIPLTG